MDSGDILSASATVKAEAVQGYLGDSKLRTFCIVSPKWYLGVVIAYPTKLPGVEGSFAEVRRSERIRGAQEEEEVVEESPQYILLKVILVLLEPHQEKKIKGYLFTMAGFFVCLLLVTNDGGV